MKAAVLHASNDIRYEEIPEPIVTSGSVKIRVHACGICGSDIPRVLGNAAHYFPIVLGHEFSGEIVEIGTDVTGFSVGDRVVCAPLVPCFKCPDCAVGNYSLCKHYTFIGSRIYGGMAEYVVVPAQNAVKFSAERSYEEAALLEPATVGLHGVRCNDYKGGGYTAVVGAGTIGLFTAQWAHILGAKDVIFFDIDDDRLKLAEDITGLKGINTRSTSINDAIAELTQGHGFDYVFGTSGATASYLNCLELTANKAHVCFIGTPSSNISFSASQWELINRRELRVTGSWMSFSAPFPGQEWTAAAHFMGDGRLRCDRRMIHKLFPLEQCAQAFDCFKNPAEVKGRVMFSF